MGRKPKIRVSYANDAGYLIRLQSAIERDEGLSITLKRELVECLSKASSIMLRVTSERAMP